jgi:tetraacyldisaccharide 4'-kinase
VRSTLTGLFGKRFLTPLFSNPGWIRRVWERKGLLGKLLWLSFLPLSLAYYLVVQARNWLYSRRLVRTKSLNVPVVSVGNLTVGGTGKTPVCLWLAHQLEKRGLTVGILSGGYKRTTSRPLVVPTALKGASAAVEVAEAGDEPSMMARIYGKTVCVDKQRYQAGNLLLSQQKLDCVLLDDGYQHRQLERDVDLLLLGRDYKGCVLPAGPFREPASAWRRADFCLITAAEKEWGSRIAGKERPRLFLGSLQPKCLIALEAGEIREYPLSRLDQNKIVTVAGIANPEGFYSTISEWGGEITHTLEFPDHHLYDSRDWQRIGRAARSADLIITTEKDILKLVGFPVAREKLMALRVEMVVENGATMVEEILNRIAQGRSNS